MGALARRNIYQQYLSNLKFKTRFPPHVFVPIKLVNRLEAKEVFFLFSVENKKNQPLSVWEDGFLKDTNFLSSKVMLFFNLINKKVALIRLFNGHFTCN